MIYIDNERTSICGDEEEVVNQVCHLLFTIKNNDEEIFSNIIDIVNSKEAFDIYKESIEEE